jgi:phage host-nuclease inhibitor protein Gam
MTKRIKPVAVVPTIMTLEAADAALAEIARQKREIALIEAGMNERIDRIKEEAARDSEPARQHIAGLEQSLKLYVDYHKDELFKSRKSLALTFGTIGYRASTKIKLLSKWTWERVLDALREYSWGNQYIRIKEEPDKEALKGLGPERLQGMGCKVVQEDVFFYETAEQDIAPQAGVGDAA